MHNDSILEGKITEQNLIENYNWFNNGKQQYKPNDSIVNELKPYVEDLTFIVVLGTWCGDSKEHVPHFYKLIQKLKINETQIELIAVDRKKKSIGIDIALLNIEYVPTFIVFYKGKEAGRIIEDTKVSLEKDLLQILHQYTKK